MNATEEQRILKIVPVPVEQLLLDPENPRLDCIVTLRKKGFHWPQAVA